MNVNIKLLKTHKKFLILFFELLNKLLSLFSFTLSLSLFLASCFEKLLVGSNKK